MKSGLSMNCFMGCALGVMSKLLAEPKITGFLLKVLLLCVLHLDLRSLFGHFCVRGEI